jgi:hypothetical protein
MKTNELYMKLKPVKNCCLQSEKCKNMTEDKAKTRQEAAQSATYHCKSSLIYITVTEFMLLAATYSK